MRACPRCQEPLPAGREACPACGAPAVLQIQLGDANGATSQAPNDEPAASDLIAYGLLLIGGAGLLASLAAAAWAIGLCLEGHPYWEINAGFFFLLSAISLFCIGPAALLGLAFLRRRAWARPGTLIFCGLWSLILGLALSLMLIAPAVDGIALVATALVVVLGLGAGTLVSDPPSEPGRF